MNSNEFESRLEQIPLQPPPRGWRKQILGAACAGAVAGIRRETQSVHRLTLVAAGQRWLHEWLWPHPVVWGAMAAIWLAVGAVQVALREPRPSVAPVRVAGTPEAPTLLNLQNQWLLALNEPLDKPKLLPTRPLPPQSATQRNRETLEA